MHISYQNPTVMGVSSSKKVEPVVIGRNEESELKHEKNGCKRKLACL